MKVTRANGCGRPLVKRTITQIGTNGSPTADPIRITCSWSPLIIVSSGTMSTSTTQPSPFANCKVYKSTEYTAGSPDVNSFSFVFLFFTRSTRFVLSLSFPRFISFTFPFTISKWLSPRFCWKICKIPFHNLLHSFRSIPQILCGHVCT